MPSLKKKKTFNLMKATELPDRQYVPTGIPELDKVIGGFPRGQVSEVFALEKVGKTTLTLIAIAALTQAKKKVIFVDVENSFNKDRALALGIDLKQLIVAKEFILEDVAELILQNAGDCEAIIVDSLPQLIPRREDDGEVGDANIGVKAKVLNELMRRITPVLEESGCAAIFINQLRPNVGGGPYDPKYVIPGGWALRYAAALRLELKRNNSSDLILKTVDGEKVQIGHTVHCKVVKTKNGAYEGTVVDYKLMYEDKPIIPETLNEDLPKEKPAKKKATKKTAKKPVKKNAKKA